jgi:hypothetical protein
MSGYHSSSDEPFRPAPRRAATNWPLLMLLGLVLLLTGLAYLVWSRQQQPGPAQPGAETPADNSSGPAKAQAEAGTPTDNRFDPEKATIQIFKCP